MTCVNEFRKLEYMEEINLQFFRQLSSIEEEMFQHSEEIYSKKTDYQKRSEAYAECREIKEELEALENGLKGEELIINLFTDSREKSTQKHIKSIWKEACKLCHPDIVKQDHKIRANRTIQILNKYYSDGNIEAVEQILSTLQNEKSKI